MICGIEKFLMVLLRMWFVRGFMKVFGWFWDFLECR